MAKTWKVVDRFQVDVGQDAAPPAETAAPAQPQASKRWNVVDRFPASYATPAADDNTPAVMPPSAAAPARVSAASPHTVPPPEEYGVAGAQMGPAMIPGPLGSLVRDSIEAANAPPPPSWGDVVSNLPTQFKASAAQTVAGMKAMDIASSSYLKTPPKYGTPEWDEWVRRVESAQEGGSDSSFLYDTKPNLTPDRVGRLNAELAIAREAGADLNAAALPNRTLLQRGVGGAVTSAPPALAALATGMVTGNPLLAAGSMYPMTAGQEFPGIMDQLIEQRAAPAKDLTPEQLTAQRQNDIERALFHSRLRGASGSLTELLPFSKLLKPEASFASRLFGDLLFDIPGENIDQAVGDISQAVLEKPEGQGSLADVKKGLLQAASEAPETSLTSLLMGGAQATATHAPHAIKSAIDSRKEDALLREAADRKAQAQKEQAAKAEAKPAPPPAAPADTMAAPPVSGSPPPDSNSPKASAPIGETGQGVASTPPPPEAPAAAAAPAPGPLTTTPATDKRAGVYDVADSVTAEGPQTERVKVVVRPDGTGFIARGSDVVDISAQLKTGASAEQIIANNFSASQKPESVTRIGDLPVAKTTRQKKAAPPAPLAPTVPEPAPVPQTQQGSTTVQEPPAGGAAPTTPTRLELPSRKKGWKGGPDAEIEVVPTDGGFKMRYGVSTPTGGTQTPIGHSKVYPTHEEALQYAAKKMRALVEPVAEDGTHQKGEDTARARIRGWLDKVAPVAAVPTEHMAAPSEKPGIAPKAKRGTLKSEGIEVEEGQVDEAELERLFGKRTAPAADTGTRGQVATGQHVSTKGDDADAGVRRSAARERADARNSGRDEREVSGRTADGKPPAVGWREKTAVRNKDGEPRTIWRGSTEETSARDFTDEALGHATQKPVASLGVYHTVSKDEATRYGPPRPANLDLRNPKLYTQDTLPTLDSKEEWRAHRAELERQGFDGIHLRTGMGQPDWYIAFHPDQVIHDEGVAEEEAPSTAGIEVQELGDKASENLAGKTGTVPEGEAPKDSSTPPDDPLRRIAAKRAADQRAQMAKSKTPPIAPKRDQELGRSNFDAMWRDLFAPTDPEFTGPRQDMPSPESLERRETLIRRIQNAPLSRQMRLATQKMKTHFDFKGITIDPKMSPREALDAMLDAYNNLHTMANAMGLPRQSMGFNGKLTLQLKHSLGNKGTRGMFSWNFAKGFDASTLALARRADSFTHEWIHALDLNLLMRYTKSHDLGVSGLADYTRNPLEALPPKIRTAFTDLMRTMFLADEKAAQEMARLTMVSAAQLDQLQKAEAKLKRTKEILDDEASREARAVEHEKTAAASKTPFIAAGAQKAADTLRARTKQAKAELATHKAEVDKAKKAWEQTQQDVHKLLSTRASKFHQGSAYIDQLTGQKYFSLPAEMLARAGESWMGNRVGQQVGVEFLSGSPDFYNNNSDRLMALVYPNESEREAIFQRYDDLFAALSDEQYFTGDTVSSRIPGETAFSKELYVAALSDPKMNAFRRVYEATKHDFVNLAISMKNLFTKSAVAQAVEGMRGSGKALSDWGKFAGYSVTGRAQTMIEQYRDNPKVQQLLRKLFSKIATNPGARDEAQQFTAQEDIDREMKKALSVMDRIIETHQLDQSNEEQMKQLFEEFTRPTEQVRAQMTEHLNFLKSELATLEGDRNKTTEAASMRRYIARIEKSLVARPEATRPPENIQKAALAMRKLADQLYYKNRDAGIDMGYVSNHMARVLNKEKIDENRAEFLEQATLAYQMNNLAEHQRLQREAKKLEDLAKAADAAEKRGVPVPRAAAGAKKRLAAVRAEMAEIAGRDAAEQAEAYLYAIEVPDLYVPDRSTPKTKYTKSRVLGPAADVVLSDFYMQNPIRALQGSIATTAYRSEYAKRFGNENQELLAARNELLAAGLDPKDLEAIDDSIKVAFGQTGNFTSPADTIANWLLSLAQMKMLSKAVFTNVPEPFNTAAVTGRAVDGWKALAYSYLPILRGADRKELNLVMELLGITASSVNETIIANRSGMEYGNQPLLQRMRAGFGYTSLVHPLTNLGNFGSTHTLMDYTHFIAESWASGTAEQKTEALAVFNEFGVPPSQRDEFAAFVRTMPKGRPTSTQLLETGDAEMKTVYAGVISRMLRYSIQQTQRVDRSRLSFGRTGRFVFSITNFNMSYQRNVLVRQAKIIGGKRGGGAKAVAIFQATYMAAMLTGLGMLAKMAREYWDDPDRDEKKQKPEDFKAVLDVVEAADRAGLTGMLTTPLNYVTKFKFDRDLSGLAVGAVPAFYLDAVTKMGKGWGPGRDQNSQNTNLDERKAWGAFYDLTVGMAATPVAVMAKVTGPLGWIATSKINSRGWKEAFAETMAPVTASERASADAKAKAADRTPAQQRRAERESERRQKNIERRYGP